MSREAFCTCDYLACPHHPHKHDDECTPCIEKNLHNQEIPACFFYKIGADGGVDSPYTFDRFAEQVLLEKVKQSGTTGLRPGKYIHFKGGEYELLACVFHSETLEEMVLYRALYGEGGFWVRPAAMWSEIVEHEGRQVRRFTSADEV